MRKDVLEERPKTLTLQDAKVQGVHRALFDACEGNWIGYNVSHDVALPGADEGLLPFLMYPAAEVDGVRFDEFAPDSFRFSITAEEVTG